MQVALLQNFYIIKKKMNFLEILQQYNPQEIQQSIRNKTYMDVENALNTERCTLEDFKALISPAAENYIEQMAQKSMLLTQERFGKTIQLYIPLYVSNYCENTCVYCGFNAKNKIQRKVLSEKELLEEAKIIKEYGFEHILLVSGEATKKAGVEYLKKAFEIIKPLFSLISIEVQPLEQKDYEELIKYGLNTVYLYQETYIQEAYPKYHPKGKKSDFEYRLDTFDRLGKAGVHKIGLGILAGLEDWQTDSFLTALHLKYLQKNYWKTNYSISFPRLRPHAGIFEPNVIMTDKQLAQLIFAYRILDQEIDIALSTRESEAYRDNMLKLGITTMSAGSKTNPGAYNKNKKSLEQFEIHDNRTPAEIKKMIKSNGYEVVWKNWDNSLQ